MKILLSAFACHPHQGSEPGVGWHWAIEIAKLGHEVWVLTHTENKVAIEAVLENLPTLSGKLHFIYYRVPKWLGWWRRDQRGIYPYYVLWQWGAYRFIKKIQERELFDLVHHITYGGVRVPSFMGGLGIPFIFGPVGGGERAPWRLRFGYSLRGWLIDALRDISNAWIKISPLMRLTFRQAKVIYVRSSHTRQLIPKKFRYKTQLYLGIGLSEQLNREQKHNNANPFQVLYAGRFLHWKGMRLGFAAFKYLLKTVPNARLTLVGDGKDAKGWQRLVENLGLQNHIDWIPTISQAKLFNLYSQYDVFLFPSLRDSAGMVVLEAMKYGLPVVCLDLGGPSMMVDSSCGRVIATQNATEQTVIQKLGEALIELAQDSTLRTQLAAGARVRAEASSWENVVRQLYQGINNDN